MAVAPAPPLVSADEYLKSSYHPDVEYVDGVLKERGMPTIAHSLLQMILIQFFGQYQKSGRFLPLPEVRTQVTEHARYRIPDVILCPTPLPAGKVITSIPWAVIEILSPDDTLARQLERFRDYKRVGVLHMVLLDPEDLLAYRFENGSLLLTEFTAIELPTGSVPFDTAVLFQQLTERLSEAAG